MIRTDSTVALAYLAAQGDCTEPCPDLEALVCLAAGETPVDEKNGLIAHLGRCDHCYAIFCESRDALDDEDGVALPIDASPFNKTAARRRTGYRVFGTFGLAASLLIALFLVDGSTTGVDEKDISKSGGTDSADITLALNLEGDAGIQSVNKSISTTFEIAYRYGYDDRRDEIDDGDALREGGRIDVLQKSCTTELTGASGSSSLKPCMDAVARGAKLGAALADLESSCQTQVNPQIQGHSVPAQQLSNEVTKEVVSQCENTLNHCMCADRLIAQLGFSGNMGSHRP